jgi:plastocyanin
VTKLVQGLSRALLAGGLAVAALAVAPHALAEGREYTVTMANMSYGKIPTGLMVGDAIVWVNHYSVIHSVTARDKSFDIRLPPGQSARQVLDKAGTIPFICNFHSQMRGSLQVAPN